GRRRRMRVSALLLAISLLFCSSVLGQVIPESAQVHHYFPHLANGGLLSGQWQTTFTFTNPNPSIVNATLYLFNNDGRPLQLDFGTGFVNQISFSVSALGTRTFQSRVTSQTVNTGWAVATSTSSLQGVLTYRWLQNGITTSEVSVPSTLPTKVYFSFANPLLG